jgi:hypothetical protein
MEIDFPKELAANELARTSESRRLIIDEHSASFRWLMASLLAINSGGLFLLKDMAIADPAWQISAAICFYLGIVAALAVAWFGQRSNRRSIQAAVNVESFWAVVSSTGRLDQEAHSELIQSISTAAKPGFSRHAGWLSLLFFTGGLVSAGCGSVLLHQPVSQTHSPAVQTSGGDVWKAAK